MALTSRVSGDNAPENAERLTEDMSIHFQFHGPLLSTTVILKETVSISSVSCQSPQDLLPMKPSTKRVSPTFFFMYITKEFFHFSICPKPPQTLY